MITSKWRKRAEIYKLFAEKGMDLSEPAAETMFNYESEGKGNLSNNIFNSTNNGYYHGKRMMDLQVTEWKEGIKEGILFKQELYRDKYPKAWLDEILSGICLENKEVMGYIVESMRT